MLSSTLPSASETLEGWRNRCLGRPRPAVGGTCRPTGAATRCRNWPCAGFYTPAGTLPSGLRADARSTARADIVFTRSRISVFIDGCFWHGCPDHGRSNFAHNPEYWPGKIAGNIARDSDTNSRLTEAGWTVLRFWEHETPDDVVARIEQAIERGAPETRRAAADLPLRSRL